MNPWPEVDLCSQCPSTPCEQDEQILEILEAARKQTERIRKAELKGEQITADVVEMRLQ
jgi:hypothetical protein